MTPGSKRERGAAAVEMAMVVGLLVMIAIGAFEYGMAFRSWFGVTAASREGARIGASAGSATAADCTILEAAAAALLSNTGNKIVSLEVFKHNPTSGLNGPSSQYRPFDPDADDTSNLVCGAWFEIADNWPAASRDDDGANRDWLGVEVTYRHSWITGALWWNGVVTWTDDTIMHLEPVPYSS